MFCRRFSRPPSNALLACRRRIFFDELSHNVGLVFYDVMDCALNEAGLYIRASVPSQPAFLDRVVCLAKRAEHAVSNCPEVLPVHAKSVCQPFLFSHLSHSLA